MFVLLFNKNGFDQERNYVAVVKLVELKTSRTVILPPLVSAIL